MQSAPIHVLHPGRAVSTSACVSAKRVIRVGGWLLAGSFIGSHLRCAIKVPVRR
jgi:hypothetical protein